MGVGSDGADGADDVIMGLWPKSQSSGLPASPSFDPLLMREHETDIIRSGVGPGQEDLGKGGHQSSLLLSEERAVAPRLQMWTATRPQAAYLPRAARPVRDGQSVTAGTPPSQARALPLECRELCFPRLSGTWRVKEAGRGLGGTSLPSRTRAARAGSIQAADEENQPR